MLIRALALLLGLSTLGSVAATERDQPSGPAYVQEVEQWRKDREAELKAPGGWLSVNGLYWLESGANTIGTGRSNKIVLPAGSAPARLGTFVLEDSKVFLDADASVPLRVNKRRPRPHQELSATGRPDQVTVQDLTLLVIRRSDVERGDRFAIRVRDLNSPMRRDFKGLTWWPVQESFRVTAAFVPYVPAKQVPIVNILGDMSEEAVPGYLEFTIGGRKLRLDPYWETPTDGRLFVIFRDRTSGDTSYGAGRYAYVDFPGGRAAAEALAKKSAAGASERVPIVLDFNKAYNPPCAVTPYATCPLPPKQNWLPIAIDAGEQYVEPH